MTTDEAVQFIRNRFGTTDYMREAFLTDPGGFLSQTEAEDLGMSDETAAAAITVIEKEWGDA